MRIIDLNIDKNIYKKYQDSEDPFSYVDPEILSNLISNGNTVILNGFNKVEPEFILSLFEHIDWFSSKPQILVIVPDLKMTKEIFLLIDHFHASQSLDIEIITPRQIKTRSVLNGQVLIGTPVLILDCLEKYPNELKGISVCYLIDGYKILSLGYRTTIQKIFNRLQSKVAVISGESNQKMDEFFQDFKKSGLKHPRKHESLPEYTKPRALLRYLSFVQDKRILVVVKKKRQLKLLKQYFKRHNYSVSENYDVIQDYHNHNLIYLVDKKTLKTLNFDQFELIFNYNIKNLREKIMSSLLVNTLEPLKDFKDKTKEKLTNSLKATTQTLRKSNLSSLEDLLKDRKKGLRDYIDNNVLDWPDEMRKTVFETLLPEKEIVISDAEDITNEEGRK